MARWNVLKYRNRRRGGESRSSSEWTENQSNGNGRVSDKLSRSLNEQQRSRCVREITGESVKDSLTERHCEIEVTRRSRPRTMLPNLFQSLSFTRFFVRLKHFSNDMLFASQTTFEKRRSTHKKKRKKMPRIILWSNGYRILDIKFELPFLRFPLFRLFLVVPDFLSFLANVTETNIWKKSLVMYREQISRYFRRLCWSNLGEMNETETGSACLRVRLNSTR